ncbi:MAG: flippase-like domain-containing protein [Methanomassiliicoccales archaeon]|nr:MAG: flippase-like domain-containing protein [Methanomassiliicoccales archaeon]
MTCSLGRECNRMEPTNKKNGTSRRQNIFKIAAMIAISLLLVWFLLSRISLDDAANVMSKINLFYVVLAFAFFIVVYLFRALRFYFLLNKEVKMKELIFIVFVHNMINTIMPARTGELSYIYILKRYKIPLEERIATLITARIFDFITISCFFFVSVLFLRDMPDIVAGIFWAIALCLAAFIILLGALLYYGDSFKRIMDKFVKKLRLDRFKFAVRLQNITEDTISSFETIRSRKVIVKTSFLSVMIWISSAVLFYFYLKVFRLELEVFEIILLVCVAVLLPLLPFYALGGFGTTEAVLTLFFVAFGIAEAVAIAVSFGIHIVALIFTIITGSVSSLKLGLRRRGGK